MVTVPELAGVREATKRLRAAGQRVAVVVDAPHPASDTPPGGGGGRRDGAQLNPYISSQTASPHRFHRLSDLNLSPPAGFHALRKKTLS